MENPVALNVCGKFPLATTQWVGLSETDSNKWLLSAVGRESVALNFKTELH